MMNQHTARPALRRPGFTLVEILVVIIIIGILAGIAIPAITGAIQRANEAAAKMEVTALADAVEKYRQEYGDYPPDGSSWPVLQRHMRKLFPRMSPQDQALLAALTHPGGEFSPVAMDRAEAVVFFLGGFSDDLAHPLTGKGGPLEFKNYAGDGDKTNPANYQYNATRDNAFFSFDPARLDMALVDSRYVSTDEVKFGYSGDGLTNRGGANDLLPAYTVGDRKTPLIYFDSRTYGVTGTDGNGNPIYNGFLIGGEYGAVRPYKTEVNYQPPGGSSYGDTASAFAAVKFHNPDSFQIISPGDDGVFGAMVSVDPTNPNAQPVHFTTENGYAVTPNADATNIAGLRQIGSITVEGFQDLDWSPEIDVNGHLDNVTNFSSSTLQSDLE